MAVNLTQPFVNNIVAQTPTTTSITITVNVLGGDPVERIRWRLRNIDGSAGFIGSFLVNDPGGDGVRSFSHTITGITLTANEYYEVRAHTVAVEGNVTTNSVWSEGAVFACYQLPTLSFYAIIDGTQTPIGNNPLPFTEQPVTIGISFSKNDISSPATLSTSLITLYDSANEPIFTSNTIYGEGTTEIENMVDNQTYSLTVRGVTADGMPLTTTITGLTYSPATPTTTVQIAAENVCRDGTIRISGTIPISLDVSQYIIQRKDNETNVWQTIATKTAPIVYNILFYDALVGSNRLYSYRVRVTPTVGSTITSNVAQAVCSFVNTYITDGDQTFKLTNEWTETDSTTNFKTGLYEPYGSKYPIVVQNGTICYDSGTTSAVLLSPTTESGNRIDRYSQVLLGSKFANFLANRQPKVLKDLNGNVRIVATQGNAKRNYVKELGNGICSTSFSWVQISDFSQSNLQGLGLFQNQAASLINTQLVKGNVVQLNLDGVKRKYRVLNANGTVVELLGMFSPTTTQKFGTSSLYFGSALDLYLNITWYGSLTSAARNAIIPKSITSDIWYSGTAGNPDYTGYYGTTAPGASSYSISYDNFNATANRNVYALSIQDVLDYVLDTSVGDGELQNYNIWEMLWGDQVSHPNQYPWLRSVEAGQSTNAWVLNGENGRIYRMNYEGGHKVTLAFQIDLSKL